MLIYGFHSQMINRTTWISISTFICFKINQNLSTNIMIYVRFNGHDSNFQFTTNAMVNDGTKVKASSRVVKDEESKVHSSKRAKCGCQT
jgi:hypothetical protein